MKLPIHTAPCDQCGREKIRWINLSDSEFDDTCECGQTVTTHFGYDFTIGYKILLRSYHEFAINKDFSLSIVFSATAVDCDLCRLHHKWQSLSFNFNIHISFTQYAPFNFI